MQVLSNTPLPAFAGATFRHFGQCGRDPEGYRPEAERRPLREILAQLPAGFEPDLLLFRSPEYLPVPDDLEAFRGPRVLLITDWNVCLRFLPALCRLFDTCFTDAPGTRLLRQAGVANVHAAPLFGHDPHQFRDLGLERDLDLSFCGNLNSELHAERNRLVFRLAHWGQGKQIHLRQAFGAEYVRVLNRSRLVFNFSVRGEANMRLYEAMACGAAVLVEKNNEEVPLLFEPGVHYLAYDPERLESQCDGWLQDPELLRRIGRAAQAAVAEHTQTRQLQKVLQRAQELTATTRFGDVTGFEISEARRAAAKLRILGAGYGLSEALDEIQTREAELPGLAAETMPGLLFLFLESAPDSPARPAALAQLAACLESPTLPPPTKTWFRIGMARTQGKWKEVLRIVQECRTQLEAAAAAEVDPGYGVLYPPIQLGRALNGDLNRCFRAWIETQSHAAFYSLLDNLALNEAVQASIQTGRSDEAARFASAMQTRPWRAASPWPWMFSLSLLGGDAAAVARIAWAWLDENPLDAQMWERMLKGLQATGAHALRRAFFARVLPAARLLLTEPQWRIFSAWENAAPDSVSGSPASGASDPA